MTNEQDVFLTLEEVAKLLKMAPATVYRMARKGKIPAIKIGRVWRFSSRRLNELFEK